MAPMFRTRTGGFPIGFRRGWSDWQKDLSGLAAWASSNGFALIDLGGDADISAPTVASAGLGIGSADLLDWNALFSHDAGERAEAVAKNAEYCQRCAAQGIKNFFVVVLPKDPSRSRAENFGYAVEGFAALCPSLEQCGGRVAIEGWPGPGALACTPEGVRALFREVPSPAMGLNYDPSHLLRMGIDPVRFLKEFVDRVAHVHGKDTELLMDGLYEYGSEQPPTFGKPVGFGGMHWRYCIPGHGHVHWPAVMAALVEGGYSGGIGIELEDAYFNGTTEGEQTALLASAAFLASV